VSSGLAGTPGASHAGDIAHAAAAGALNEVVAAVPPQARETVGTVARDAFASGLNTLFVIAAIIAFVGAGLAAVLVRQRDFVAHGEPQEAAAAAAA
jgi:hypothetical protein